MLRGQLLRRACAQLGCHCVGLAAAARAMFKADMISGRRKMKMIEVDIAYNITRHISMASVDEFYTHGEYANKPFFEALEFAFRFQQAAGSTLLEKYEDLQFKKIKPKGN